ncbi:MAG TPA: pyridine nucleotide-disulfide oxidoreductase [Phycisphaerales bacterium]|nr:pyridine nucleotide-disulfide oxidoreductase [Phycisphaerales bacterium]
MDEFDVAVVGGGPIGIEMHAALVAAGKRVVHFEAGRIGHTFSWWAPRTRFFSSPERIAICGVPLRTPDQGKASAEQYGDYLLAVVEQFGLNIKTFERVDRIERDNDGGFVLHHAPSRVGVGGQEIDEEIGFGAGERPVRARHVVLAIGNMHRPRAVGVPGETLAHVSHYLGHPGDYFDKRVVIVGGKNSAAEAAIRLYRAGAHVTLSYRGDELDAGRIKYWVLPELVWLIEKGRVEFVPETRPVEIRRDAIELAGREGRVVLPADFVLLLTGYVQDGTLYDQLGLDRIGESRRPRLDRETMQTSVPGIFVAGTASSGSQTRAKVFIENSHAHVDRICRAIAGVGVPWKLDEVMEGLGQLDEEM